MQPVHITGNIFGGIFLFGNWYSTGCSWLLHLLTSTHLVLYRTHQPLSGRGIRRSSCSLAVVVVVVLASLCTYMKIYVLERCFCLYSHFACICFSANMYSDMCVIKTLCLFNIMPIVYLQGLHATFPTGAMDCTQTMLPLAGTDPLSSSWGKSWVVESSDLGTSLVRNCLLLILRVISSDGWQETTPPLWPLFFWNHSLWISMYKNCWPRTSHLKKKKENFFRQLLKTILWRFPHKRTPDQELSLFLTSEDHFL